MYINTLLHEGYNSNLEFMTKIFGKNIQALNLYTLIYFFQPFHIYQFSMGFIIEPKGRDSRKQIVIFRKVTTCFNFKDMFRCCQHHRQLQNI